MKHHNPVRTLGAAIAAALAFAPSLMADSVDTRSGAHIVGKVTQIADGKVTVSTDYAGDIVIKQKEVTAIATSGPIAVRLASGTRLEGQISSPPNGAGVQISGNDGTTTSAPISRVEAAWPAGTPDPEIVALQRHWVFEASTDVEGTSGNKTSLGTAAGFKAKLATPQDELQFNSNYNRQVSDGQKSADQFKAGADYEANFAPPYSWYVNNEAGYDRVMAIKFYDISAAGIGRDFIKNLKEVLTGRVGLSYRYDGYETPNTPAVNSAGLDFELAHEYHFANAVLENKLTYVPAFNDFANYAATHESSFTIPLHQPNWKLQLGLANDYDSKPPKGIKKLDTTYFTRFLLDWGN